MNKNKDLLIKKMVISLCTIGFISGIGTIILGLIINNKTYIVLGFVPIITSIRLIYTRKITKNRK